MMNSLLLVQLWLCRSHFAYYLSDFTVASIWLSKQVRDFIRHTCWNLHLPCLFIHLLGFCNPFIMSHKPLDWFIIRLDTKYSSKVSDAWFCYGELSKPNDSPNVMKCLNNHSPENVIQPATLLEVWFIAYITRVLPNLASIVGHIKKYSRTTYMPQQISIIH